jgi:hypothetical protein
MRFLWTYLVLVIVFALGFVGASTLTVGMPPARRARRIAEPEGSWAACDHPLAMDQAECEPPWARRPRPRG